MPKTATYLHAIVQPGRLVQVEAPPGVREGEELDVVLLTETAGVPMSGSVLEILDSLPQGLGTFKSAQEVDAYVRSERESWER